MENISFQPDEITVDAGTTVTWTNQDSIAHTTTSEETVWDSGNLQDGDTFSFTFDEPGTYAYFCEIHPDRMRATITVEG
ncbi:MAG: cupredoxin domain-containing protein [Actinobacteria bacterium]|nr:cupredoxin domain-containing protein [Actinomycetota bacterium]